MQTLNVTQMRARALDNPACLTGKPSSSSMNHTCTLSRLPYQKIHCGVEAASLGCYRAAVRSQVCTTDTGGHEYFRLQDSSVLCAAHIPEYTCTAYSGQHSHTYQGEIHCWKLLLVVRKVTPFVAWMPPQMFSAQLQPQHSCTAFCHR